MKTKKKKESKLSLLSDSFRILLPRKLSLDNATKIVHGFGAETSFPLTQDAREVP